ncbi:hypothetical protein UCMB321_1775 [Pseudomonas batumici]|uniref:Uncharacterized protein n=1 Tax=Pseudomonas batumici TaxID=226910 RepID=A0A0C2EEW9_9PSED|nr:hypothetical protein UCMB321_1775 [Pseudomonas batumici]
MWRTIAPVHPGKSANPGVKRTLDAWTAQYVRNKKSHRDPSSNNTRPQQVSNRSRE